MVSNSVLIVYIAAPHSKVTVYPPCCPPLLVFLYSFGDCTVLPTLLIFFLTFFHFTLCSRFCFYSSLSCPLVFKWLCDGQVGASTGLCSTEGTVPPCAKVMLGSHIAFYE